MIVTELSKGIKLFLLVGGKGTRLKDVTGNTPKPLIDIHGKPFLSRVIESLSGFDITLVCSNENVNYFKNYGYDVLNEGEASGTAGWMLKTDLPESFYVMNGDTFFDCDINVDRIVSTIFTTEEIIEGDEGYIIGDKGKVSNFVEKNIGAKGYRHLVNSGIYKFYKKDLDLPSKLPLSLEYDILPNMNLTYQTIKCKKFDIGTPERLENFRQWFSI
jgi:D-glycero-alpha-D-manno-heptose 1-phosphate guanylyltransferase